MSAFEQKVQVPDKNFQQKLVGSVIVRYIVFAAAPYENIAFKIPNREIDKGEGRFVTQWNVTTKTFKVLLIVEGNVQLQMFFKTDEQISEEKKRREASHTAPTLKIEYRGRL